jgi:hypothetical protein
MHGREVPLRAEIRGLQHQRGDTAQAPQQQGARDIPRTDGLFNSFSYGDSVRHSGSI